MNDSDNRTQAERVDGCSSEVRDWFYANGWEASPESWYDEEGIEAWRWWHPDHEEEFADMGDWSEPPPVTDEMVAFMERHG
jgi:hypothetical protein